MNLRQLRWPVVFLALSLTLASLFGIAFLVKNQVISQPLSEALAKIPGLESHSVHQVGSREEITVLIKGSADLKSTYTAVYEQAQDILGKTPFTIKVTDHRTPELEQVTQRFDLYIQEGIATGRFAVMADQLEAEAQKHQFELQVGVDGDRVYLSVRKGDAYLYNVVERFTTRTTSETPAQTSISAEGGGSL